MAALDTHLVLIGFMGAGKSTLGAEVALRIGRPFYDVDDEIERLHGPIDELFARDGETAFRRLEANVLRDIARRGRPAVIALGGGAVEIDDLLASIAGNALVVHLDVDVETAWQRARGSSRPLAQDEAEFRARYDRRAPLYTRQAHTRTHDADGIILAAAGIHVERGALQRLGDLVPGTGPTALASDAHVAGIHGMDAQLALGARLQETHELPQGEAAKQLPALDRLWQDLRLDRSGTLVALGGGTTTDAAGFAAATYLRGIAWTPVPTTLVGQVDAAIGGKTAIDLPQGKNLVGAFHWPDRTIVDPALLETLPHEQRLEGTAEVVKTALLAGEPLHELADDDLVRRTAAFKAGICLKDPQDHADRKQLNLGHTFAHALEAAAGYEGVTHGRAVALGLLAALRLSGRDTALVEDVLQPKRARVDRDAAWAAVQRDKKTREGELRLVLLEEAGPVWDVPVPAADVRSALDELIAQ